LNTAAPTMPARFWIGHVPVDDVTRGEALERIAALVEGGGGGAVFTPNVDHVVLAEDDLLFREAYASVALSLVDGMPVLWVSRLLGMTSGQKVSGSDLIRPLMGLAARRGFRVYLLGAAPAVARRAAEILCEEAPGLQIVGTSSPLIDMDGPPPEREAVRLELRAARPDLVLVALGPPKAERFIHECRPSVPSAVLVSVGAGLDFVVGVVRRAPPVVSACGFEWLFRLLQEPRRLWKRYLLRGPRALPVFVRSLRSRYPGSVAPRSAR
jgi:N-acetylglucosaminyldiphosphoundecaprenol N-acetyl-beta-D-mannosaminyltransferase